MTRLNEHGQPVGPVVPGLSARPMPPATPMVGAFCRVEPLSIERHAAALFDTLGGAPERWTYLNTEPPATLDAYRDQLAAMTRAADLVLHAIVDPATDAPLGVAALMRIDPGNGVIEVGHIHYGAALRQSLAGTEAMALLMRRAFDELGYRRYEWKCDALNAPSRAAALRYGFTFEGIFRQALVTKGRNRDTAWYSIVDREWPRVRAGFDAWLDPANFDAEGRQRVSLAGLRARVASAATGS